MEFISARELKLNPKAVWKRIRSHAMGVVTINGQPSFLISKLNPEELEDVIYIQNRIRAELALSKLRGQAVKKGSDKFTPDDINIIIQKTRRARKK